MPARWAPSTKRAKPSGVAEAGGRRVEAGRLVAPGRIVGMLGDRQELDMGEAHVDDVGDQPVGQLVLGQEAAVVARAARSRMDLVDRDRLAAGVGARARTSRCAASPQSWSSSARDDRGGRRAAARSAKAKGSAFSGRQRAVGADDLVLVGAARRRRRGRRSPRCRCRGAAASEWRRPSQSLKSPTTETRGRSAPRPRNGRRRRPHGRCGCAPSLSNSRRCVPSRDVVVVHRAEHRAEGVGVGHPPFAAGVAGAVAERLALADRRAGLRRSRRRGGARALPAGLPSRVKASSSAAPGRRRGRRARRRPRARRARRRDRRACRRRSPRSSRRSRPAAVAALLRLTGSLLTGAPPRSAVRAGRQSRLQARFPRFLAHIAGSCGRTRTSPCARCCGSPCAYQSRAVAPERVDLALGGGIGVEVGARP